MVLTNSAHGGFDGGAVANDGTMEKDINLNISLKLRDFLTASGYDVVLTRDTDSGTEDDPSKSLSARKVSDLKNRLKLMEKYPDAIYVSIHLNKFTASNVCGAQVFYSKNTSESAALGEAIQHSFRTVLQPQNNRVIKQGTKSTYLLYNATIPSVIVECGFISNAEELKKLKQTDYQNNIAFTVFCGINSYFSEI